MDGYLMHKITATIKREWFREIVAKRKRIEFRDMSAYWEKKLDGVKSPFLLRLINGMQKAAPEATVRITKVSKNRRKQQYEFHLGKIEEVKNWDIKLEQPLKKRI
jgi:hypothetical protein